MQSDWQMDGCRPATGNPETENTVQKIRGVAGYDPATSGGVGPSVSGVSSWNDRPGRSIRMSCGGAGSGTGWKPAPPQLEDRGEAFRRPGETDCCPTAATRCRGRHGFAVQISILPTRHLAPPVLASASRTTRLASPRSVDRPNRVSVRSISDAAAQSLDGLRPADDQLSGPALPRCTDRPAGCNTRRVVVTCGSGDDFAWGRPRRVAGVD